jgi:hypothetical protein
MTTKLQKCGTLISSFQKVFSKSCLKRLLNLGIIFVRSNTDSFSAIIYLKLRTLVHLKMHFFKE